MTPLITQQRISFGYTVLGTQMHSNKASNSLLFIYRNASIKRPGVY